MSQDELVDIVDENNKVLYQATKKNAHEKGLLHRCVVAEVIRSNGDFVMIKQASDRQDAGQYVSPVGGHIQSGETEKDALKRETLEEIGIKDFKYKHVGKVIFDRKVLGRHENHYLIVYEIYSDNEFNTNGEVESYKQFTKIELKDLFKNTPELVGAAGHYIFERLYSNIVK